MIAHFVPSGTATEFALSGWANAHQKYESAVNIAAPCSIRSPELRGCELYFYCILTILQARLLHFQVLTIRRLSTSLGTYTSNGSTVASPQSVNAISHDHC